MPSYATTDTVAKEQDAGERAEDDERCGSEDLEQVRGLVSKQLENGGDREEGTGRKQDCREEKGASIRSGEQRERKVRAEEREQGCSGKDGQIEDL